MLIDDLRSTLKEAQPDVETIQAYWKNSGLEERFHELETQSHQEDFWQNSKQTEILKEIQRIRVQREQYLNIMQSHKELSELLELFQEDEQELKNLKKKLMLYAVQLTNLKSLCYLMNHKIVQIVFLV